MTASCAEVVWQVLYQESSCFPYRIVSTAEWDRQSGSHLQTPQTWSA
ncbi:hypothetical protein CIB84_008770 [Bambusicola thoracicus]|uniref:Uncharacterized protein n=1 Tax=Bambusicola thoracicus TaxID=9083 RepID=A0A2P4STR8_BAMTH|nr:hypothetical protein CIB84_008770 [Bambusicola thoracicus]